MLGTVLEISISMSVVILVLLALMPLAEKKYSAKGRYVLWLLLAVRLLIPINYSIPHPPVRLAPEERVVVLRTDSSLPLSVMTEQERSEAARGETGPANYATLFPFKSLVTVVWLLGAAAFMLFHLIAYWDFSLRVRNSLTLMGERGRLKYYCCSLIETPVLIGFFRPHVLIPDEGYTPEELEVILLHETTHFRQGDLWYKMLLLAANAVHWFNPAVYLMIRRANRDLEYSCDETVIKNKNFEFRRLYSLAILKTMKRTGEPKLTASLGKEG